MKLKRKIDGILSEANTKYQLGLLLLVFVVFGVVLLVTALVSSAFDWQDIFALVLDPGVFGNAKHNHDVFRLIITLLGILIFAALLIPGVTNILSDVRNAYNKGERRYPEIKDHVLILGANRMLMGMLNKLQTDSPFGDKDILIVTTQSVEQLRDRIEAYFGGHNDFMSRITFYYDERNNEANLREANADKASYIFIIGEDNEIDHDSVSIECCEKLEEICKNSKNYIKCSLVLDNQSSAEVYHYYKTPFSYDSEAKGFKTKLMVDVIDIKEYVAEQTLLGLNESSDGKQLPIDGEGITKDSDRYIHFVVSGMTPMAKAMALAAAHLCHFPNFKKTDTNNVRRTIISFVAPDIEAERNQFISEHGELFKLSHYRDISFDEAMKPVLKKYEPDNLYGDFLDVEWEFVNTDISSPAGKYYVESLAKDAEQQLVIAICQSSQERNTSAALHLPSCVYEMERNIPIYVHLWEQGDVITKARKTGQFGHIYCFGTGTSADEDPLFTERRQRGQRVNFVYSILFEKKDKNSKDMDNRWYSLSEANKFSSIYCANSIDIKQRSFPNDLYDVTTELCDVEHRRWMMSVLLLGYKAYPAIERRELIEAVRNEVKMLKKGSSDKEDPKEQSETWRIINKKKREKFLHIDIDDFDDLVDQFEKDKDKGLILRIPFIVGGDERCL